MADRKPSFSFRFWSSGGGASSRRTSATQTTASRPTTTTSTIKPEPLSRQSTASNTNSTTTGVPPPPETPASSQPATTTATTTFSTAEPEALSRQSSASNTNSTATTPPPPETSTNSQPTTTNMNPNPITALTTTTTSIAEPEALNYQSTAINTNPTTTSPPLPPAAPQNLASIHPTATSNTNPDPTTAPVEEDQPQPSLSAKAKTANKPNTNPKDEPKTLSPSSSLATSSPSRRTSQSRSPPQPSSPARASPKARPTPPSPSRVGPKTSSRLTSPSPKKTTSNSPSKESTKITQEISSSHKPLSSTQQEPQLKADAKFDSANGFNDQTVDGTSSNRGALAESDPQPQETKDVNEVVQSTTIAANDDTKKDISAAPLSSAKPTTTNDKSALSIGDRQVARFHKGIKDDVSTFLNRTAIAENPKSSTVYDRAVSVITLAGENRGALMHVGPDSSRGDGPVHIHRSYNKIKPYESSEATTTDGEESSKEENKSEDAKDKPTEAFVNNNAQGINNSLVFNGSITERNPGVHMVVSHIAKEPIQSTNDKNTPEARKAEFNTTRAEKLTYEPTIRRRCLRGLFLETSDSDDNPEKPRRHGCRVGCQQISDKDNDINV